MAKPNDQTPLAATLDTAIPGADPIAAAAPPAQPVTGDEIGALAQQLRDGLAAVEEMKKSLAAQALAMSANANATSMSAGTGLDLMEMPERDPKRHYTTIPAPVEGQMDSPVQKYLAMESPSQPGRRMYRIDAKDPMITGDARVWQLSCLAVDYDEVLRRMTQESNQKVAAIAPLRPPAWNDENGQTYDLIRRAKLGEGLVGVDPNQIVATYAQ